MCAISAQSTKIGKNQGTIQESDTEQERSIRDQQEREIYLYEILTNYLKNKDYFVKNFIILSGSLN